MSENSHGPNIADDDETQRQVIFAGAEQRQPFRSRFRPVAVDESNRLVNEVWPLVNRHHLEGFLETRWLRQSLKSDFILSVPSI